MEASELRIGNYLINIAKTSNVITRIDIDDLKKINYQAGMHYVPIPLTEQLLLKCGFTKNEENKFFRIFIKSSYEFEYNILNKCVSMWYPQRYVEGYNAVVRCEFLHQIQNLYFALTGTELKIEL